MASVENSGSKNGKRSLNMELNLVPFIDLLSMCICFLLMTAVWLQLSTIKVHQSLGTTASSQEAPSLAYQVDVEVINNKTIQVEVKTDKKLVKKETLTGGDVAELFEKAKTTLTKYQQERGVGTLLLTPHQDVTYSQMISFFDSLKAIGIQNFGVVPVRAR